MELTASLVSVRARSELTAANCRGGVSDADTCEASGIATSAIAVTAAAADTASAFETDLALFGGAVVNSRSMGILDASHSEAGYRGNNPTDKNGRSEQCRCRYRKTSRIYHPVASLSSFESGYGQASDGADLPDQK